MALSVLLLVLFAAFLHASWNIIVKGGDNKVFEIGLNALGGGLGGMLILPFLPLPPLEACPLLGLSCLFHLLYTLSLASTYKIADLSIAYPAMRGTAPILTALLLAMFGSLLPLTGWCGVALLSAGLFCLAWQQRILDKGSLKGILYALRTSLCITGYTLADGFGARLAQDSLSYTCWIFFLNIFPIHIYIFIKYGRSYVNYLAKRAIPGLTGGICGLASYGIAIWAMTVAPIALVAALRETSVIFGMLMAVLFLGEKLTVLRAVAIVLVMGGAMLARL